MRIAVHAFDGITMFHLATPQMVFGEVARNGLADWETVLFSEDGADVMTAEGYRIGGLGGLDVTAGADVVVVPSWHGHAPPPSDRFAGTLRRAHSAGSVIVGLCLGTFPVADSGLLAGRPAVTHWGSLDRLRDRHPDITVDRTVLYIDHGDVLTSAGTAAGIDACLHLVRTRLGVDAANLVARSLVVAPHRSGGQAQYIDRPVPEPGGTSPVAAALEWAVAHLDEPIGVDELARVAHMSRRSFLRAFRTTTGTTPARWLRTRRLDEVKRLLEVTDLPIDQVAARCGFGSPVTMRQAFSALYATTPSGYRRQFGTRAEPPAASTSGAARGGRGVVERR